MPTGVYVSGLESDGGDQFFCGGGPSGKVRAVRRPRRGGAKGSGDSILVDAQQKVVTGELGYLVRAESSSRRYVPCLDLYAPPRMHYQFLNCQQTGN